MTYLQHILELFNKFPLNLCEYTVSKVEGLLVHHLVNGIPIVLLQLSSGAAHELS